MARKIRRRSEAAPSLSPSPVATDIEALLAQIMDVRKGPMCVDRVELQFGRYNLPGSTEAHPISSYQVNVKRRDAGLPWTTSVGLEPGAVLVDALTRAAADETGGPALFYSDKAAAEEACASFREKFAEKIRAHRVEFVPYKGWTVVLMVTTGSSPVLDFGDDVASQVEFRFLDEGVSVASDLLLSSAVRKGSRTRSKTPAPEASSSAVPDPSSARAKLPMKALMDEYKARFGKQPNTKKFTKLSLAAYLDELENPPAAAAISTEPDQEDEDDLL